MTRDFPEVKVGRLGGRCPSLYNSLALPAAPPGIRTPVRRIIVECTDHKATPRLVKWSADLPNPLAQVHANLSDPFVPFVVFPCRISFHFSLTEDFAKNGQKVENAQKT
jgi:hypothetical protein